ncbi:MAG: bifunctional metallophosphatase/5'-nucleotidase [Fidelibacterota bacterium]|nr:MAG: bifunctional metallophosphatase/5'-nucleotidase [Candidatus Neomarinimicrobiota bacterium]
MKWSTFGKCIVAISWMLLLLLPGCQKQGTEPNGETERQLVILYTNDEHGWMEAMETTGGAAGMLGLWKEDEGYTEDDPYLVLSGGDMWTGPAVSTLFKGESMVEVMNTMGYDAAAIGNHEFDFQVSGLYDRLDQAAFPFLSANIREKSTGNIPDFAQPYVIEEANGIQVGLIGLTTTSTPTSAFPDYVADYDFIPYSEALTEVVPQVRAAGAELLMVVGHINRYDMQALASTAAGLGIAIIGGGHDHRRVAEMRDGVALIEGGGEMKSYGKVELTFDTEADTLISLTLGTYNNIGGDPDAEVASIVSYWTDQISSDVIGYVNESISRYSPLMHNMVTDAWLAAFPEADISATNRGGFRADIPAGEITPGTIVGVLPFENFIVELEISGSQLVSYIQQSYPVVGGMTTIDGYFHTDGTPLAADSSYSVLVTDYMWSVSDSLQQYDPEPLHTNVHWRDPVIDWIRAQNTTTANPLDDYLDPVARQ